LTTNIDLFTKQNSFKDQSNSCEESNLVRKDRNIKRKKKFSKESEITVPLRTNIIKTSDIKIKKLEEEIYEVRELNNNNLEKSKSKLENINMKKLSEFDLSDFIGKFDIASEKSDSKCESYLNDPVLIGLGASFHSNQNLEDNSNRSLFKISEESLINTKLDNCTIDFNRFEAKNSSCSTKKRNYKKLKSESAEEDLNKVLIKSNEDLSNEKIKDFNFNISSGREKLKFETSSLLRTNNIFKLRRAQSEISFIQFEKLVEKTLLSQRYTTNDLDNKFQLLKRKKQYYSLVSKYKDDYQDKEKKINYLKSSHSSKLLNNASNFEKLSSWKRIMLIKSKSFQNLADCLEHVSVSSNNRCSYSKLIELRQFKNTLEFIELLNSISLKIKIRSNPKLKANYKNETENVCNSISSCDENEQNNYNKIKSILMDNIKQYQQEKEDTYQNIELKEAMIDITTDNKKEYEKQGAIPKNRNIFNEKFDSFNEYSDINLEKRKSLNRNRLGGRKKSNGNISQSMVSKPDYISNFKLKEQIYDDINLNPIYQNENEINHQHNTDADFTKKKSNFNSNHSRPNELSKNHSIPLNQRYNLTSSASAAVKMFRRDFIDRFNPSNNRGIYRLNDVDQVNSRKIDDHTNKVLKKYENHYEKINIDDYYYDANSKDIENEINCENFKIEDDTEIKKEIFDIENSRFKNRSLKSKESLNNNIINKNLLENNESSNIAQIELKPYKETRFNEDFSYSKLNKNRRKSAHVINDIFSENSIFDDSAQDFKPFLTYTDKETEDEEDKIDIFNKCCNKTSLLKSKLNSKETSSLTTNDLILSKLDNENKYKKKRSSQLTYENFMEIIKLNDNYDSESNDDILKNEYIYDDIIDNDLTKEIDSSNSHKKNPNEKKYTNHNSSHYRYNFNLPYSNLGASTSNYRFTSNLSNENSYSNYRSRSWSSNNQRNYSISLNLPEDPINQNENIDFNMNSNITRQSINKKLRMSNRFRNTANERLKNLNTNSFDSILTRNLNNQQFDRSYLNNEYLYIDNCNLNASNDNKLLEDEEIKKKVFHWKITKFFKIKIPFDHFSLLAMLDKNKNISELICSVIISSLVAIFASLILCEKLYDDILAIVFCFIIASCHYSLIKSVQPDSSSPFHGFNSLTAFSRPIYFCLICSVILFLRFLTINDENIDSTLIKQNRFSLFDTFSPISKDINVFFKKFSLYGYFLNQSHFELLLSGFEIFLLFFPLVFTFGLFPQITTFFLCILEQIDMYIFGGTAMNSLLGAILSLMRSILFTLILSSILFSSIYSIPTVFNHQNYDINSQLSTNNSPVSIAALNNQFSQSVVFSIYCGLLVIISYLLSRQSSNIQAFISMIKDLNFTFNRNNQENSSYHKTAENESNNQTPINLSKSLNENDNNDSENGEKKTDSFKTKKSITSARKRNKSNSSSKDNDLVDDLNSLINLKGKKNREFFQLKKMSQSNDNESQKILRSKDESEKIENPDSPNLFNSSHSSISSSSSSLFSSPSEPFRPLNKPFKDQDKQSNENGDSFNFSINEKPSHNNQLNDKKNNETSETQKSILEKDNENLKIQMINLKNFGSSSVNKNEKIKNSNKNKINQNKDKLKNIMGAGANLDENEINFNQDPNESKNKLVIRNRLESDLFVSIFIFVFVFAIHVSTVFTALRPIINDVLFILAIIVGAINHYVIPHLRLENPWYFFNQPLLKPKHWSVFEPNYLAKMEVFEIIHVGLTFFEKNILNVLVILSSITSSSDAILLKYEPIDPKGYLACLIISVLSLKLLRNSYCNPAKQYQIFFIAYLFNKFDSNSFYILKNTSHEQKISLNENSSETILIDLFLISLFLNKLDDFLHKLQFIYVYTAPWQLPWGSAFHAFAQPLSAPHTSFLLLQAFLSSLICSPLMPFMGSAIFLLSYVRPVKFWEKNYKTKRVDNSNTRLQSQLDGTSSDSENLNAIFYEHLTSVLQNSLCGDIMMGRWGNVQCGDFYVLSSDYLNCLVHIIETGNGFITFQLRGLEFKGTYCQQRELEAITEDNTENENFCCCKIGHLKYMLSFNAAFHLRWVAWSVVARKYIVNAYRIVDNDLSLIVNFFSLRRTLVDFYIKSAIYYLINSTKLNDWLKNPNINEMLNKFNSNYIDYDTCFDNNLDMDYDIQSKGVLISKFYKIYSKWITHCRIQRLKILSQKKSNNHDLIYLQDDSKYSLIVKFSFALSLVCRRALVTACTGLASTSDNGFNSKTSNNAGIPASMTSGVGSNNMNNSINSIGGNGLCLHGSHIDSDSLASFQHGYYTLFKGDIRIQSSKDEWVFTDMDILKRIVIPGVRMGLRLHQDHFQNDTNDEINLYENLTKFETESVISYEKDPIWRFAVLNSIQSLLSLRHQFTEYSDQYKVVMLNKSFLSFRVIKINKECVRSFWAGQQHELIFLRNKNQERGSIQNAKQVLRNIINSSCDQPIGYPIYVSPLTTSYSSTHSQINRILGNEFTFKGIYDLLLNCFRRFYFYYYLLRYIYTK
jgi:hypothetical protein